MITLKRSFLLVLATVSLAQADTFVWDADGGLNSPTVNVNAFVFGSGNSLSKAAIPFTALNSFQMLFQSQLNSIVDSTGSQVAPLGLNAPGFIGAIAPYEVTMVGSITETVTTASLTAPQTVTFQTAITQISNSFVEIYYDGSQNANALAGTGYNDGILILQGVPFSDVGDSGTFVQANPQPSPPAAFDNFGTDDYPGTTSVSAVGATRFQIVVTYVDPTFFIGPGSTDVGRRVQIGDILTLNMSQATPFDSVDPSQLFVSAMNTGIGSGPVPSAVPQIGSVNGTSGPDFQAQTLTSGTIRSLVSPGSGNGRVSIRTASTRVVEGHDTTITFTYKGLPNHPAIVVNYSVKGNAVQNDDYTLSGVPGQVVIPPGSDSASITFHAVVDELKERKGEAAKILVAAGQGYAVPENKDARRVTIQIVSP